MPDEDDLDNEDFEREEKSDEESQAEGGMRATEPGHVGAGRLDDWIEEARDLEGHDVLGAEGRRHVSSDAGFEGDMAPEGWTGADLDRRRRAAKRVETDHHPPASYYRDQKAP
jgi:hypothetical protein